MTGLGGHAGNLCGWQKMWVLQVEDTPAFVPAVWLLFCALIPYFVSLSQELAEQVRAGELEVWDVSGELSGLA